MFLRKPVASILLTRRRYEVRFAEGCNFNFKTIIGRNFMLNNLKKNLIVHHNKYYLKNAIKNYCLQN